MDKHSFTTSLLLWNRFTQFGLEPFGLGHSDGQLASWTSSIALANAYENVCTLYNSRVPTVLSMLQKGRFIDRFAQISRIKRLSFAEAHGLETRIYISPGYYNITPM